MTSLADNGLRIERRRARFDGWTIAALLIAALATLPVAVVAASIFVPSGDAWSHLAATVLFDYFANTLWLMAGVALLTFVIGVSTAWLVTMCTFPGRRILEWALVLPLAMPAYAVAYTYAEILDYAGIVQTWLRAAFGWSHGDYWFPEVRSIPGAVLMLGLVLYPYVYMLARAAFLSQSVCLLEISRTLGSGPWRTFLRVGLPMARPAIVTGIVLALMETIGDYGVVQHFSVSTFSTGIFRTWYGLGNLTAATQLAALLLGVMFLLLAVERLGRGGAAYHHTTTRYRPLPAFALRGAKAWGAIAACIVPLLLGFAVPAGLLATWAVQTAPRIVDGGFWRASLNSVTVAALAAVLAVAVALVLAFAARMRPGATTTWATRLATLGYAVPGAVVAVGVMIPFGWFDNTVDSWMRDHVGVSTGLLLSGTLAAMLFCYVVRFLAISFNAVESGLSRITPNMDRAARSLGAGPWAALRRIHTPLLRGSLLTAAVLVFVDTMKELPATLILRPFNFDTLAIRTYELAGDERLADASTYALSIVLFGLLPVILLSAAIARSRPGHQ